MTTSKLNLKTLDSKIISQVDSIFNQLTEDRNLMESKHADIIGDINTIQAEIETMRSEFDYRKNYLNDKVGELTTQINTLKKITIAGISLLSVAVILLSIAAII